MRFLGLFLMMFFAVFSATAQQELPLPRFVSVKSDQVNLRTGPGLRYPIEWILTRRHMPVEVIDSYDQWRRIRDIDGDEGWVHQTALSGKRWFITTMPTTLYKKPSLQSQVVAFLDDFVQMKMQSCPKDGAFCKVDIQGVAGWVQRSAVYGIYPHEFTK